MQRLPEQCKKYGYTLKLVKRSPNKAIYGQYVGDHLIAYEVIKIRVRPKRYSQFLKVHQEAAEIYPCNEQWGDLGWTCKTREKALEKYNSLI